MREKSNYERSRVTRPLDITRPAMCHPVVANKWSQRGRRLGVYRRLGSLLVAPNQFMQERKLQSSMPSFQVASLPPPRDAPVVALLQIHGSQTGAAGMMSLVFKWAATSVGILLPPANPAKPDVSSQSLNPPYRLRSLLLDQVTQRRELVQERGANLKLCCGWSSRARGKCHSPSIIAQRSMT